MSLSAEQKQAVAGWVTAGDSLSQVQKKLLEQFKVSMTYMDVRFLVDDLDLTVKDAAPKTVNADLSKAAPAPAPKAPPAEALDAEEGAPAEDELPAEADDLADALPPEPPAGGNVTIAVDKLTLIPGALASGTVTFSDGVTGKWIVDNYGRPGFTEISQPGYRPSPADGQAFMRELSEALSKQGF